MEAKGTSSDHAQSIVDAFDDSVGMASLDEGEDPFLVASDGSRKLDEGFEPAASGSG